MADFTSLYNAIRQAQDRAGGVKAAMSGYNASIDRSVEQRKVDFAQKLAQLKAAEEKRSQGVSEAQKDAGLALDAVKARQGAETFDPVSRTYRKTPGADVEYDVATHTMRARGAPPPKVTNLPNPPKEAAAPNESPEQAITTLKRIRELNKNSYGGLAGAAVFKTKSAANLGEGDVKYRNTSEVLNTLRGKVVEILKKSFGAQLSDAEREYMDSVVGADVSMSQVDREIAIDRLIGIAESHMRGGQSMVAQPTKGAQAGPTPISGPITGDQPVATYRRNAEGKLERVK